MVRFNCHDALISGSLELVAVVVLLSSNVGLGCYTHIFSFGDSIIDTGNFVHIVGDATSQFKQLPYGMTYFRRATGRISDGRVILDFYAQAFKLPFVPPSLVGNPSVDFQHGANFAVFAATALPPSYYKRRWGSTVPVPFSLDVQLTWFKAMLPLIAAGKDPRAVLNNSLIVLGEIGGNDYNFWFAARRPREVANQLIPDVVAGISSATQEIISMGAKTIVIPGNFPIGCVTVYLNNFHSSNPSDYDNLGCLTWFNEFSKRHNQALKNEINRLKPQHPGVKLIYADYYEAAVQFFRSPSKFGIQDPFVACCGGNGAYHTGRTCNSSAIIWGRPSTFANWDSVHMTDNAYNVIADGMLYGPYADIPLLRTC